MGHFLSVDSNGITITARSSQSEDWKIHHSSPSEIVLKKGKVIRQYLLREIISETEWRATLLDQHEIN